MGGPIKRDRVWFYGTARTFGEYTDIAGRFGNLNAGDPTKWAYVADRSITSRTSNSRKIVAGRVTAQLSQRNKVSASFDKQMVCAGSSYAVDGEQCRVRGDDWVAVYGFGTWSPESTMSQDGRDHIMQFSYTAPVTNKLLLEAAVLAVPQQLEPDRRRPARSTRSRSSRCRSRASPAACPCPTWSTTATPG